MMSIIDVIIPAHNEEASLPKVLKSLPRDLIRHIVVCDNGSTDQTAEVASAGGAKVVMESRKGYGFACQRALAWIDTLSILPDIIVFIDADYSDYPEELPLLIEPIQSGTALCVIGSRKKKKEPKSMTPQQIFGNWLACMFMRLFFDSKFTDLGPFRAMEYTTFQSLGMSDTTYGWTVELQLKVLRKKIAYSEVDVRYRQRIGQSKVSGTVKGSILAGVKIIGWIFKYALK